MNVHGQTLPKLLQRSRALRKEVCPSTKALINASELMTHMPRLPTHSKLNLLYTSRGWQYRGAVRNNKTRPQDVEKGDPVQPYVESVSFDSVVHTCNAEQAASTERHTHAGGLFTRGEWPSPCRRPFRELNPSDVWRGAFVNYTANDPRRTK